MESVIRAALVYLFLLVIFRITGKHSLAQITTFDFVLVLIIGEATQQALLGDDFSVINAWIVIATLIVMEITLTATKRNFPSLDRYMESQPTVIVEHGVPLMDRLQKKQIDIDEILSAARVSQGIGKLEDIEYAILERSGGISIIPKKQGQS